MSGLVHCIEEVGVSVIIPTYQESENIVEIVTAVLDELGEAQVEVLVVDDDSPDRTWGIAREVFEEDSRVRVIRRTEDRGLGQAVQRGFQEARGKFVAVLDADFQHPPSKLRDLFLAFDEDVDLVIGSRHLEGGGIEGWSRTRRIISRAGALVSRFGVSEAWRITDPMSGFFAVRRSLVKNADLRPDGYKVLLEVLAKTNPGKIVEVPYTFQTRRAGDSKLDRGETLRFISHASTLSLGVSEEAHADILFATLWVATAALFGTPILLAVGLVLILSVRAWDLGRTAGRLEVHTDVVHDRGDRRC